MRAALVGIRGMGCVIVYVYLVQEEHCAHEAQEVAARSPIHASIGVRNTAPNTFVLSMHTSTHAQFEEAYRGIANKLELPGRNYPKINIS